MRPFHFRSWLQTFVAAMTFTVAYTYAFLTYPQHRVYLYLTTAILGIVVVAAGVRLRRRQ